MSDLIDRQVAIDALHEKDPSQIWDTADVEVWVNSLPSAQPTCNQLASDCISRQAAREALASCALLEWEPLKKAFPMLEVLDELPSVQPEQPVVIRCKDCKFYNDAPCGIVDWWNSKDDFCSRAEKRER